MKTAFDNVPIHIPGDYMFVLGRSTYGNCDNVSGHSLDRVCREVERLVGNFPDRLTMASTGGPVTGCDEGDCAFWQSNTRKLEDAGAMGVEYSLSCPQGGDGTNGDLVCPERRADGEDRGLGDGERKRPDVPKLFKLTGGRHRDPADRPRDPGGARPPSRQEGRRHAGEQLPVARVPAVGRPPLGRGDRDRHVGRGRPSDQQPHPGEGGRHGRHGLRQRRRDVLPRRGQLPRARRRDRPVLHRRHEVRPRATSASSTRA